MEVLWFGYMKKVVCNGDDLILNESGDSSVVTRWTVDPEVIGLNPTHGFLHIELGFKTRVYVFADWL